MLPKPSDQPPPSIQKPKRQALSLPQRQKPPQQQAQPQPRPSAQAHSPSLPPLQSQNQAKTPAPTHTFLKASARVAPTTADRAEKPREAAHPVQPAAEPSKYHDACGSVPPPPPVRTIESKLATAALSQSEASYHVLPECPTPDRLEDGLPNHPLSPHKPSMHQPNYHYHPVAESILIEPPGSGYYCQRPVSLGPQSVPHQCRPDAVPPHLSFVSKSEPQIPYLARADNRYSTLGPRSYHHSIKSRGSPRGAYMSAGYQGYSHDRPHGYPTIRRVHSLHVPSTIRSAPVQRTEVPPDDDLFLYHRPIHQCKAYQHPSQAEYHVTQLQPYFENGRVQYRYSPYAGSSPADLSYYDIDPYGTIRVRPHHSHGRDPGAAVGRPGAKATGYHYLAHHVLPLGKEHSFVSRDMPPGHGTKEATYLTWDPEESERFRMHSIRRESRARQKVKGPVLSQYDNVGLFAPADLSGYETQHLRSKSDPGKTAPAAAESKDGRYHPRQMASEVDALAYMETDKYIQGGSQSEKSENKQSSSKRCQSSHSVPGGHKLSCQQDGSYGEARHEGTEVGQGGDGSRSKHWPQEQPGKKSMQPHYGASDFDHHQAKLKTSSAHHRSDGQTSARSKQERSQSVREQQHCSQGIPEPDGEHSHQRHGAKTPQSHYDNLDDYHPVPPPQAPVQKHGGSASYPAPGSAANHSNRAYSTALGQGAFIQTELATQRPETEIRTE